jgi:hypothetical protein
MPGCSSGFRASARAVDGGGADNGHLDTVWGAFSSSDNDLVDVSVERVIGEIKEFIDAVPVIMLLGSF